MSTKHGMHRVLVAGTYTDSDAYPNVHHRIKTLESADTVELTKCNFESITAVDYTSRFSKIVGMMRIGYDQILQTIRCLLAIRKHRRLSVLYIPYPAIFILLGLRFLPGKWAPSRVVADCFISVYDTLVIDRKLVREGGLIARVVRLIEKIALQRADLMVTDTIESADHISSILNTDRKKFVDLPLAINETVFSYSRYCPDKTPILNVLFVGTLVPLHRISVLLDAALHLSKDNNVRIKIVGDGQQAHLVDDFINSHSDVLSQDNFIWIRQWQNSEQLHKHIEGSDVCIGILGNVGKSDRVWPFKNYLYMATGRALITADTSVARRLDKMTTTASFITLANCTGEELAKLLKKLSINRSSVQTIASDSRRYFDKFLSKSAYEKSLLTLLLDEC